MLEIDVQKRLRCFDLDLELKVAKGEVLMLVGENGCGKTALLDMIAGLKTPDSGEIVLSGRILFDSPDHIDLAPEMRNVGYVFQNYALFPHLNVHDNIAFGLKARGMYGAQAEECIRRQMEHFRLWDLRNERASRISGGEKQRVALARALITGPEVLLLDEPLAALDIRRREAMRGELRRLIHNCGLPGIVVTHDLQDVKDIGDRVCILDEGRIVQMAPADEFLG